MTESNADIQWYSDSHRRVAYRQWLVPSPKVVIHIVHGMAEHSGCYDDVARLLNVAGFSVFAHDHCCHGENVAIDELGVVSDSQNWDYILKDMLSLNTLMRDAYLETPLAILGHSMGSFIAQRFAQEHPDRADFLLLEGSSLEPRWLTLAARWIATFECVRQGPNGQSPVLHALTFGGFNRAIKNPRTAFDWVSRETAFVDAYLHDPRCGVQVSNAFWRDMFGFLNTLYSRQSLHQLRPETPVYLFSGDRDPVGHNGKGVKKLAAWLRAYLTNVTVKLYPEARHDVLHEINQSEVIEDLISWLRHQQGITTH
ncbi:MAG: alpha-beta hydrolase superfamily lysophospholipase [Paracoccaceae bacterium]|jgi:alpha-beta hydrolase superfamily lysophospholipase